jgi:hypothetical protein
MIPHLIYQEDKFGCALACLAMITGQTYQQVKAGILAWHPDGNGISELITDSYLADHGYAVARKYPHAAHLKEQRSWPPAPFGAVHLVCVGLPAGGHLVVMLADGSVLDPASGYRHISDYPQIMHVAAVERIGTK